MDMFLYEPKCLNAGNYGAKLVKGSCRALTIRS